MIAFNVWLGLTLLDVVYFTKYMTADEVRTSLINHDGYSSDIFVHRASSQAGR